MHRAKRLGEFTVMNMEDLLSCRKDEAPAHVKEYIYSKISSHPSSRIVITLSSKGSQLFSFVTFFCTLADFPLYLSHQILDVTETKKKKNKQTKIPSALCMGCWVFFFPTRSYNTKCHYTFFDIRQQEVLVLFFLFLP